MKMSNLRRYLFILVLLFLFCSCATKIGYYNPDPKIADGAVSKSVKIKSISLINDQPDKTKHRLAFFKQIDVDYHAFTQSVIDALTTELSKQGITVSEQSDKKLYIKISLIDMREYHGGQMIYKAKIKAVLSTGDGQKKSLIATRSSFGSGFNVSLFPTKPLDAAYRDMVGKILTSPKIQTYLEGN